MYCKLLSGILEATLTILAHSTLHMVTRDEEHGAPPNVHAVVGYALQVMDHQCRPNTPLGRAPPPCLGFTMRFIASE